VRDLDGLADGARGSVAVSASMSVGSYLLPPILSEFRERRPLAEITLHVSDPEGAITSVQSGDADFAVIVGDASTEMPTLEYEAIGREDILLVAAPDFLPETTTLPLSALRALPLVSSPGGHIRRELIDRQLLAKGVVPENVVMELGHPEAMKSATQHGLGACLLFRSSVVRELEQGSLRSIELEDASLSASLALVIRKRKRLSSVQEQLVNAVRQHAGRTPAPPVHA
jgi:DNA-binding transcriptional LysR family regulator